MEATPDDATSMLADGTVTAVFGTLYADRATGKWHERDVGAEFGDDGWDDDGEGESADSDPTWRTLDVQSGGFTDLEAPLLEIHGDAGVVAVGVGRGDPVWGPSVLDAYFRNLRIDGVAYELPATLHESVPENWDGADREE